VSLKVMTQVWERTDLSQSQTLVALALADHADDEGECWPSLDRVAEKSRLKKRQTQRVIQQLEQIGILQVERAVGRRNTNCYRFTFHDEQKGVTATPFVDAAKGVMGDAEKVSPGTEKVSPVTQKGVTAMTPESSLTVIEPSEEPPGLDREAWDRFFAYRREIRRPIKPASIPASQRLLAGFGADQAAIVEQTVGNGWQGLFPLKNGPAPLRERRKTRYEQMQETLRNATEN
jgi:hypothetical protein